MSHQPPSLPNDLSKAAVVFIEFQREWLDRDGKLDFLMQDRRQFADAIEGGRRLLKLAREHGLTVVHSGLRFADGHPELGIDGHGLRGAVKRVGTFPVNGKGSEFADGFEPRPGEFVPTGRTGGSALAGSNLDVYLRANRINDILVCGFALHVCVESTLRAAHDLGYNVWLVEDASSAFTADQRRHVLEEIVHHYGERITTADISRALSSKRAA
jgi:nicotinamidase-related amidase